MVVACLLVSLAIRIAEAGEGIDLVWHAETLGGNAVMSKDPDRPVNPASVVKLASSFRALERLGPNHRFDTRFSTTSTAAPKGGTLSGGLVVEGGADPDFHFENALLVAVELRRQGIPAIDGDVYVDDRFWVGWERGVAGREPDPAKRALAMGQRLVAAWNPERWSGDEKQAWSEAAARHGWPVAQPPAVIVAGQVRRGLPGERRALLVHQSEPLIVALHRFNVFSNNDIERLDATLGSPGEMAAFLTKRWGKDGTGIRFETSSGLNSNRMTGRQVVRLVRELHSLLQGQGLELGNLLPVMGCGPSTLRELFPRLRQTGAADGIAGKTGTLNTTDGGVSALAGFLPAKEPVLFFVAAPGAGFALGRARAAEEDWVTRLLAQTGDLPKLQCPPPVPTSEQYAKIRPPDAEATAPPR